MSANPDVMTKPPSRGPKRASKELVIFYVLVLVLAFYGQASGTSSWLIPGDAEWAELLLLGALVIAFVLVLELGTVALLRRAEALRQAGARAGGVIVAATVLALGAATLTFVSHWGPADVEKIQSFAFAGTTMLGFTVWTLMSDLRMDPFVVRRGIVHDAVQQFIKDVPLDPKFKAMLIATADYDTIADSVTRDLANEQIAKILTQAIAPATWSGDVDAQAAALAEQEVALREEFEAETAERDRQAETALAELRVQLEAATVERIRSLETAVERLQPEAERAGELQREVEALRRQLAVPPTPAQVPSPGTNGSRPNGSAEQVPPQARREVREPVTTPTARASVGAAVPAPREEAAPATVKEQVFEYWASLQDADVVDPDDDTAPQLATLAERKFPAEKRETLRKYGAQWLKKSLPVPVAPTPPTLRAVPPLRED